MDLFHRTSTEASILSTAIFRRATVVLYLFAILAAGFAVIGSYERAAAGGAHGWEWAGHGCITSDCDPADGSGRICCHDEVEPEG